MRLRIGATVETIQGTIRFHDWIVDGWAAQFVGCCFSFWERGELWAE